MAKITLKGTPHQTVGDLPAVGAPAPDFHLVDGDLNDVRLDAFKGKWKILTINPSFDTAVCAAEGLDQVIPLSMMRSKNFAKDYGVLIQDGPLSGITEEPDYTAALNSIR
jgi:thiol peroxidase